MIHQFPDVPGRDLQTKGLALVMEGNARTMLGVYESLLEMEVEDAVLHELQACELACREIAAKINQI